jgi:hypothetical protein
MRYALLATLLLSQVSASDFPVGRERYELPPCGTEPVVRWAILPSGEYVHLLRIEQLDVDTYQLVGVDESRVFCDGAE